MGVFDTAEAGEAQVMATGKEPLVTGCHLRRDLQEGPGVVAESRETAAWALRAWFGSAGEPGHRAVDDALLLVSEVVTNACRYGGFPRELCLDRTDGKLWVQVSDGSPEPPRNHGPHRAGRSSGHGLYLLQRLTAHWGVISRGPGGKTVWFEVEIIPEGSAPTGS